MELVWSPCYQCGTPCQPKVIIPPFVLEAEARELDKSEAKARELDESDESGQGSGGRRKGSGGRRKGSGGRRKGSNGQRPHQCMAPDCHNRIQGNIW